MTDARSNAFARRQFGWLDKVADDKGLTHLAARLAFVIRSYVNRESGYAWPSQETLASRLNVTSRAIRDNAELLERRGHIEIMRSRGRGLTNRYRPTFVEPADETASNAESAPTSDQPKPKPTPSARKKRRVKPGAAAEGFWSFWVVYPRQLYQAPALKAYEAVVRMGKATPQELLLGAERYARERAGKPPQYTKHPANWLKDEGWKNQEEPATSTTGPAEDGAMSAIRGIMRG